MLERPEKVSMASTTRSVFESSTGSGNYLYFRVLNTDECQTDGANDGIFWECGLFLINIMESLFTVHTLNYAEDTVSDGIYIFNLTFC